MPILNNTIIGELPLQGERANSYAYVGFCNVEHDRLLQTRNRFLHEYETVHFEELQAEADRRSYLRGRYISKEVLGHYFKDSDLTHFNIVNGIFNHPIVEYIQGHNRTGISISHNEEYGVGICFSEEVPMAIDIERCSLSQKEIIKSQLTPDERELVSKMSMPSTVAYTIMWTVKEAVSKVLKTGLTTPLEVFKVTEFVEEENFTVCRFLNFTQYESVSFKIKDHVCSIILPQESYKTSDMVEFVGYSLDSIKLQTV